MAASGLLLWAVVYGNADVWADASAVHCTLRGPKVQYLRVWLMPLWELAKFIHRASECAQTLAAVASGGQARHGKCVEVLMLRLNILESIRTLEDRRFDTIYPPNIRALSCVHWTPLKVARRAAEFLVREPRTRVLDVGSGPGKFCVVGALTTAGHFTGVEQRKRLCELGLAIIARAGITNAEIIHDNIKGISFSDYDAFYLFNPFAENLETTSRIDGMVSLSASHYDEYTEYVARQLASAPLGTRVATYCGACEEVPMGYDCVGSALTCELRFWEKTKTHPVGMKPQEAHASN